jgi:hypothetical protein
MLPIVISCNDSIVKCFDMFWFGILCGSCVLVEHIRHIRHIRHTQHIQHIDILEYPQIEIYQTKKLFTTCRTLRSVLNIVWLWNII